MESTAIFMVYYAIFPFVKTEDPWNIPEQAIHSFESLSGLSVTVHEYSIPLWPYLPPERFKHHSPCCLRVKATHDWACTDFEIKRLKKEILNHPEGRCHQCHAGFMEWVIPAMVSDRLAWILFAGQTVPDPSYTNFYRDIRVTSARNVSAARVQAVTEDRSSVIMEGIRQLNARLLEWHHSLLPHIASHRQATGKDQASRRHSIHTFIMKHHASKSSVRDLARHLGLGESRTIHLVKELFGCGFTELLNQTRLKTASSLLRNTSIPVQEVCDSSGFNDLSHFHRTFRKHFHMTPLKYRKTTGS